MKSKFAILICTILSSILSFSFPYESILTSSMVLTIASTFSSDAAAAAVHEAYAQPYIETVKSRNLTIDLGNGTETNAQLTIPALGKGPYLAFCLLQEQGHKI